MSYSSRDKDVDRDDTKKEKSKYIRIWRLEASKEFIIFMSVIVFAIATSAYNPIKIGEISEQNRQLNQQGLNGTKQIISLLTNQDLNRTDAGIEIIKLLLLFDQEHQRDHILIMKGHNISNNHFVDVNSTHAVTEKGSFQLPYNLNLSTVFNQTLQER